MIWVDPSTYLPVRDWSDIDGGIDQVDFRWLRPTPTNLAALDVPVPPGFTQVSPPREVEP